MPKMEAKVSAMLAGATKYLAAKSSLLANGQTLSQVNIVSTLTGYAALYSAVDQAKQALATAHAALQAQAPVIQPYLTQLDAGLRTLFGPTSPTLAQFGLTPRGQRQAPSPETLTLANVKRAQTRKARGIIGKAQRAQISATPGPTLVVLGADGQVLSGSGASTAPAPAAGSTTPPAK